MTTKEVINSLKLINLSRVHPFLSWEEMQEVRDKAIDALEKTNWISVKDRMPEQCSFVLAFNGVEVVEAFYDGWRFGCTSESKPIDVTHWMPFPKPPEREGE